MLQLLYYPLQLVALGSVHVFAFLHHIGSQLRHIRGRLQVFPKLDAFSLPFLTTIEATKDDGIDDNDV